MSMKVMVFDVEHGACSFLRTPTNYTAMIDCGCTQSFSPALYVAHNELPTAARWNNYGLTHLTITHPHDDHISDIAALEQNCEPGILRRQTYDWEDVKSTEDGDYENLDDYTAWQKKYSLPATDPDYGMSIQRFCLTPDQAKRVDESKYINNSSIVTVATVMGSQYQEKFLFGGDMETAGWDALLKGDDDFKKAVKDVDFFVVSHHGHKSGFSDALFAAMGRSPILNILSIHHNDENIDQRYGLQTYSLGTRVNGTDRRMITTRSDGTITIHVNNAGQFSIRTEHLANNRAFTKAASW